MRLGECRVWLSLSKLRLLPVLWLAGVMGGHCSCQRSRRYFCERFRTDTPSRRVSLPKPRDQPSICISGYQSVSLYLLVRIRRDYKRLQNAFPERIEDVLPVVIVRCPRSSPTMSYSFNSVWLRSFYTYRLYSFHLPSCNYGPTQFENGSRRYLHLRLLMLRLRSSFKILKSLASDWLYLEVHW